ncbi:MAG: diaminopimelate epimerase [Firmicutes bacterium]|nr:diaminopimelate epimerase [Bacillota bacterium]
MKFTKMQGIGNDYVYVDCFEETVANPSEAAVKVSDRHFGIGSDGLVLIMPSEKEDFRMRMFNADGSEAEMCGNAIRCVGKYVYDNGLTEQDTISVETLAGTKILKMDTENGKVKTVRVDMGEPILESEKIPVVHGKERFVNEEVEVDGQIHSLTCVSMGNPHAVMYMKEIDDLKIEEIGPKFEHHRIFPKRTNTEFVEVLDRKTLKMRVWERGAGETLACGTGACAVLVASVLNGLCERKAVVKLLGGDLSIEWNAEDNHVYMTGSATKVFDGVIDL